ncbi:hypothetical protein CEXT_251471 [Caerostris extrusa]|uniref:Uncharacterized protein n=1 Tax=Caerostris extrusa TaxID=172846 RepID=A0AAV4NF71_CAEEX|nr:hypothetical protein CEXT_251471 [Caerostris extrusa]
MKDPYWKKICYIRHYTISRNPLATILNHILPYFCHAGSRRVVIYGIPQTFKSFNGAGMPFEANPCFQLSTLYHAVKHNYCPHVEVPQIMDWCLSFLPKVSKTTCDFGLNCFGHNEAFIESSI